MHHTPPNADATGNYAFIKPHISERTENLIHITQYISLSYASEERMVWMLNSCPSRICLTITAGSSIHFLIPEVILLMYFPHILWLALQYRITQSAAHQLCEARRTLKPTHPTFSGHRLPRRARPLIAGIKSRLHGWCTYFCRSKSGNNLHFSTYGFIALKSIGFC